MRIYLDMCCLKRPFDDQSQPRIHLETEAVLALLDASEKQIEFIRSGAHDLENGQNPLPARAARVRQWLETIPLADLAGDALQARTTELMNLGFKNFDAFHLANAEAAGVEAFATCDDRLQAAANRLPANLKVRVVNPVDLAREVLQ
jgi:predicted nucleic acid-binding protein